jgi:hypothetical protein
MKDIVSRRILKHGQNNGQQEEIIWKNIYTTKEYIFDSKKIANKGFQG